MPNVLEKNPLTINDSTKSPKDFFHSDLVNNWSDPRCGTCQYKEMGKLLKFGNNVFIINHFPHHGHFFFQTQFNKRIVVVLVLKVWIWKFLNCNKMLAMVRNSYYHIDSHFGYLILNESSCSMKLKAILWKYTRSEKI